MNRKIKILCTLGPSTLNKKFLKFAKGKISLLRLNMSHIEIKDLRNIISFVKNNTNIPICLDTEGAQIRTKAKKKKYFEINKKFKIAFKEGNLKLYPDDVFEKIKKNDILDIGFNNLKAKIINLNKRHIELKVISEGWFESNKGVHISNRFVKLNYITKKDIEAIKIAKEFNIRNYALSFTNSVEDIKNFKNILKNYNQIYKIETNKAIKNISKIISSGKEFLIDRGDLSKETSIENIPLIQRKIFKTSNKFKNKKIYVATNLLESMIDNNYPTRGEANDIFNSLEMGAAGLVLAAETAIGKYPENAVVFLKKMIKTFKKS